MLITKRVDVKVISKTFKHYLSFGYKFKKFDIINVDVNHLTKGSHCRVDVKCDYCGKIFSKEYKNLMIQRNKSFTKKDCCCDCIHSKDVETNLSKYGCPNPMDREDVKEKLKDVFLEKYGFENVSQSPEIKNKVAKKWNEKSDKERKDIRKKIKSTCLKKYGVDSPLKLSSVRKKLFESTYFGSSQQGEVFNILKNLYGENNVKFNVYFETLCLDIVVSIKNINIDVEYDSWYWHNPQRDRKRYEFVKSNGFLVLRIKSSKKIPNKNELKNKIDYMVNKKIEYSEMILSDWNQEEYQKGG